MEREKLETEKQWVIQGCDPETDIYDRRILFEMSGRRLNVGEFPADDETESEED